MLGPTGFLFENHIGHFLLVRVRETICLLLVQVFATYCIPDDWLRFPSLFGSAGIDIIEFGMFDWLNFVLFVFDLFCHNRKSRNARAMINLSVSFWLVDFRFTCVQSNRTWLIIKWNETLLIGRFFVFFVFDWFGGYLLSQWRFLLVKLHFIPVWLYRTWWINQSSSYDVIWIYSLKLKYREAPFLYEFIQLHMWNNKSRVRRMILFCNLLVMTSVHM